MKIILIENVDRVGTAGSIINVKDGFARNYLIPKKLAILATAGNIKKVEAIKADAEEKQNVLIAQYKENAAKIANLSAEFTRKADENGHLFGSVSENDIVNYLLENGLTVHKSQIVIAETLKEVGEFSVKVSFTQDIVADLKIVINKE